MDRLNTRKRRRDAERRKMRRERKLTASLLALIGIASSSVATAPPASSYPIIAGTPYQCHNATPVFTGPWTSTEKGWANGAFNKWEGPRDLNGTRLVDIGTGTPVQVKRANPPGGGGGFGWCWDPYAGEIFIPDAYDSQTEINNIALHEMGHALGLGHTGHKDSHEWNSAIADTNNPSAMATCDVEPRGGTIQMDDEAALTRVYSAPNFSGHPRSLTPNPGFERATKYWKNVGSGILNAYSSYAHQGTWRASFKPAYKDDGTGTSGDYLEQTVRVANTSPQVRVRYSYKHDDTGSSNAAHRRVAASLWYRQVQYYPIGWTDCGFPINVLDQDPYDYNVASMGPWTRLRYTQNYSKVGTWSSNAPVSTTLPSSYAYDLQLRLHSMIQDPAGNPGWVTFDNAFIEEL